MPRAAAQAAHKPRKGQPATTDAGSASDGRSGPHNGTAPGRPDPIIPAYEGEPIIRCQTCGVGFIPLPKSHDARYCSARCRIRAFRGRRR